MGRIGEGEEGGVVEHEVEEEINAIANCIVVTCSCKAHWTHALNTSKEVRDSIFESHKKYFNNKTLVL